ncbi:Beta-galactosidase-1-like protein [Apodemus speciosus]|uniref:Beta-galactosidase-1-like protein n=1 Tax=Apodemus speciosus TaxID=105296 RepID=A0ABQ0EDS9_APOSI
MGLTWAGTGQCGVHNRPYTCQDCCCLVTRSTKSHCWS